MKLNRLTIRYLAVTSICLILLSATGCEPETKTDPKQERLYAAKNMELQKQIESLKTQHEEALKAKQSEIDSCVKQRDVFKKQLDEQALQMFENTVLTDLLRENKSLKDENEKLKADMQK